jgi:hypothetical protein
LVVLARRALLPADHSQLFIQKEYKLMLIYFNTAAEVNPGPATVDPEAVDSYDFDPVK